MVCSQDNLRTPLMLACMNGYKEIVAFLMSLDADIELKDKSGRNSLHW